MTDIEYTSIYAAGPIDLVTHSTSPRSWRLMLQTELSALDKAAVIFDPTAAFKNSAWGTHSKERAIFIEEVNNFAIDSSDVVVAFVSKHTPSIGVPIEINYAIDRCIPVYIITDITPGASVYLDNRVPIENRIYVNDLSDGDKLAAGVKDLAKILSSDTSDVLAKQDSFDFSGVLETLNNVDRIIEDTLENKNTTVTV